MATKLKNLSISKVAVVDEGANPDAHIRMMKRKDGELQPMEGDGGKGTGNILKKMFAFIGKAAGMDQAEIDSAVEEIQKGDSTSFNGKINEANNRRIYDEMWDVCYALQSALCSILNDEELDSTSTAASMQESLDQFYALAKDSIGKWSSGKAADIVKKDGEVSGMDLEVMKSAVERLTESIEKAGGSTGKKGKEKPKEDGTDNDNQEGDEEEMGVKIDKSKMTDAEKAFYESIEKRYGVADGAAGQETESAGQGAEPAGTPGQEENSWDSVSKSAGGLESEGDQENIYKGIHPAVRAELEELKKFREAAEEKELADIAKKYAIIGKKEEELVPLFKSLKSAGGTAFNDMLAVLDQTVEAVEKSGVFSEIGKSGHGFSTAGAAEEKINTIAKGYMEKDSSLDYTAAVAKAWEDNPELMGEYEEEAGF